MNVYLRALRAADALAGHVTAPWGRRRLAKQGVSIHANIAYGNDPAQRLDVYLPVQAKQPMLTVFYVHGGGFTALSKDTHVGIARAFLAMGVAVVLPSYRLAPEHPYPAACADVLAAWEHVACGASLWGLDPAHLVLAGESAGANLVLGIALRTPSPKAAVPRAVMPFCGLLQVSDMARYKRTKAPATPFVQARLESIAKAYLGDAQARFELARALSCPLKIVESDAPLPAPLPPFLISVGAGDPVLADSERLHAALQKRGVQSTWHAYEGAGHAFFALGKSAQTQAFWRDVAQFLATL